MVLCEEGVGGAMLLSIANVLFLCGSEWLFCSAKMQTAFFLFRARSASYGENTAMGVGWGDGALFARGAEAGEW